MHPLFKSLLAQKPVLTDGAWGTQLQALGLEAGLRPDTWNFTHPDRVREVAARYVRAGSRVILTNTFRSNRIAFTSPEGSIDIAALNAAGVALSREAAGGQAKVFASIGPSGKMLMSGDVTESDLEAAFSEQARALAAAGADGLVVETMSDLFEALIALKAAKGTGIPVVVSMVFDSGKEKDRTMMGATPEKVAETLTGAGADVIGANCGLGIEGYIPVCERLKKATALPIWIKPNAGLPQIEDGRVSYRTTAEEFASMVPALRSAGADFIGGCCGTTPDFITKVAAALSKPQ